jgi:subtilisin family serine protease
MKRLTSLISVLFLGALLAGTGLTAGTTKAGPQKARLAPDLQAALKSGHPGQVVRVVASLRRGQTGLTLNAVEAMGGVVQGTYRNVDEVVLDLPIEQVGGLTDVEGLDYVTPDRPVSGVVSHLQTTTGASLASISPLTPADQPGRDRTPQTLTYGVGGLDGSGVGIAVVDSGIDFDHFDLRTGGRRREILTVDFTGIGNEGDPFGHGTHVAGIIAGDGSSWSANGVDYAGIAPGAGLFDLRVLDGKGHGTISRVVAAIDWAVANQRARNIRVLNLSLATPPIDSYLDDPLCRAVQRAVDAGIVVVAAAGNFGLDPDGRRVYGGITSPGISPSAITVGAVDTHGTDARSDDNVAPWSSRGPTWAGRTDAATGETVHDTLAKPDLVAPGMRIVSLERPGNLIVDRFPELDVPTGDRTRNPYMVLSGTSMSAPVVAGAVALMLQADPALTPNQVKALLMYSAQVLDGADLFEQGAGLLNIEGAVRLADALEHGGAGSRELPNPIDALGLLVPASRIAGERVVWSEGLIWGRGRVGSLAVLDPDQDVYALSLIWGSRRDVWGADVQWVDDLFSDDLVAVAFGEAWFGLDRSPGAAWHAGLMPDAFFSVDPSSLIWGYRRSSIGDSSLIWGLRFLDY